MVRDLGELIPLYAELEDMRYGAIIDDERFKQASDRIKELETNLGDLGHEFTGSFGSKLEQAENLFDSLTETVKENTVAVEKNITTLDKGSGGKKESTYKEQLKWDQEYNEAVSALGSYTNQKIIENDRLATEELLKNKELLLEKQIETDKAELESIKKKEAEKISLVSGYIGLVSSGLSQLGSAMTALTNNRLTEIDNQYQREVDAIEGSTLSEEQKNKKIEALDKKKSRKGNCPKKEAGH